MDLAKYKEQLRHSAKEKRSQIPSFDRKRYSQMVQDHLESFISKNEFNVILGYKSFGSELSVDALLDRLSQYLVCALPRVELNEAKSSPGHPRMVFHRYRHGDSLAKNTFGIYEPLPKSQIVSPSSVSKTLMIVPSLSLGSQGQRLGYGGGFYDRYLSRCIDLKPKALTCLGVSFSRLLNNNLPTQSHDVAMDYICSELGVNKVTPI